MRYFPDKMVLDKSEGKNRPIYIQIYNMILDLIGNNSLRIGDTLPSASVLATQLGVHYYTVRQAYDTLVEEEILVYHRHRGYTLQRMLPSKTDTRTAIMFIRPGPEAFSMSLSRGIRRYAEKEDIELIEVDSRQSHQNSINAILHPSPTVGGILVMPYYQPDYVQALHQAERQGIKVVLLDRDLPGVSASCVMADHFGGAFDATCHLLMEHDCPVYYFGWTKEPASSWHWYRGWREAMQQYNYEVTRYVMEVPDSEAKMYDHRESHFSFIRSIFHQHAGAIKERPFSILAGNDYMANYVCQAAEEIGILIGKDMFTASFSNAPLCEKVPVPLTSVEQNPEKVGYEATKLLHEQMLNFSSGIKNILIPTELFIRMSSIGIVNP